MASRTALSHGNIDLGHVDNHGFGNRFLKMFRGIKRVLAAPKTLKDADVIIARNFDLLFIAWVVRKLAGRKSTPLVYECLDIHGLFTRYGMVGRVMRRFERFLLARIQLLIVSSPGFIESYFLPIQKYSGPVSIIENKMWFEPPAQKRIKSKRSKTRADAKTLTLGWVGSIRCATSLDILLEAAGEMGPDLQIDIHGNIHRHVLGDFDKNIEGAENVAYHGAYTYPGDLDEIYASCDLVWAQDLWQRGANSDWLLPNRIYEASWFGCPSVAVAGTQTGKRVQTSGLGLTINAATAQELVKTLRPLKRGQINAMSKALLAMPDENFRQTEQDIAGALAPVLPT